MAYSFLPASPPEFFFSKGKVRRAHRQVTDPQLSGIPHKAQRWCFEAIVDIRRTLPFPLLGIDCDNGSEFINRQLFSYCEENAITFTRSRPYKKNDNCYVEQKNWPVVRCQVGYLRYDTPEELATLRELYSYLRLYVNFFQPQMKLVSKTRQGSRVQKRYDVATTPYRRVLASPYVAKESKQELTAIYAELNPVELKRQIGRCQDRLMYLAKTKRKKREETKPAPDHPWRKSSRTLIMRQPVVASRTF